MYWRISQFPELDCLEPDERSAALRQITVWTYLDLIRRAIAAGWVAALPVTIVATGFVPRGAAGREWLLGVFAASSIAAALFVYQVMLARIRLAMRRELAAAYRGRPAPFCFRCGYDLRGIVHDPSLGGPRVCPECGGIDHASTRSTTLSRGVGRFVGGVLKAFGG